VNLFGVFAPFVAIIAIAPFAWKNDWLSWSDVVVFIIMYAIGGFGITIGYHRLLTHRSFQTYRWVEYLFAICGGIAIQGGPLDWVADHRKHHAHTDEEGDPHSPHVGNGTGWRGLWHAHVRWTWNNHGMAEWDRYAKDLYEDKGMRVIHYSAPLWALVSFGLPFGLGVALTGTIHGGLTALLWGGLVRMFLLHHVTWSINSVCHFWGDRRFAVEDQSTNVWWLAIPSLGESWHHNHHAFPRSHRQA
jgi:stearoyl-CoA desaturase (delta-9 desaturase)